jgi:hypothetical protein
LEIGGLEAIPCSSRSLAGGERILTGGAHISARRRGKRGTGSGEREVDRRLDLELGWIGAPWPFSIFLFLLFLFLFSFFL